MSCHDDNSFLNDELRLLDDELRQLRGQNTDPSFVLQTAVLTATSDLEWPCEVVPRSSLFDDDVISSLVTSTLCSRLNSSTLLWTVACSSMIWVQRTCVHVVRVIVSYATLRRYVSSSDLEWLLIELMPSKSVVWSVAGIELNRSCTLFFRLLSSMPLVTHFFTSHALLCSSDCCLQCH